MNKPKTMWGKRLIYRVERIVEMAETCEPPELVNDEFSALKAIIAEHDKSYSEWLEAKKKPYNPCCKCEHPGSDK